MLRRGVYPEPAEELLAMTVETVSLRVDTLLLLQGSSFKFLIALDKFSKPLGRDIVFMKN